MLVSRESSLFPLLIAGYRGRLLRLKPARDRDLVHATFIPRMFMSVFLGGSLRMLLAVFPAQVNPSPERCAESSITETTECAHRVQSFKTIAQRIERWKA